jgi:hypothetical protein
MQIGNKHTIAFSVIFLLSLLFISCSNNSRIVSSFGKRKYTKGFFFNHVASVPKTNTAQSSVKSNENKTLIVEKEKQGATYQNPTSIAFKMVFASSKKEDGTIGLGKILSTPTFLAFPKAGFIITEPSNGVYTYNNKCFADFIGHSLFVFFRQHGGL